MIKPALPVDEAARLTTLRALNVLDTPPEERFDRLTRLARRLFDVPIALVSLVDANRLWLKSCMGLPINETPRETSFCGHTVLGSDILVIPDASQDERFHDNPFVMEDPHIRFYAGCPLAVGEQSPMGALCLVDTKPRTLAPEDLQMLRDLAHMAEQELAAVRLATHDELTTLSNRRGFLGLAHQALKLCQRVERPASLLYLDLDRFKDINDRFGHAEGDAALRSFAGLMQATFRDSDIVARLGGDEFVVLLTNVTPQGCADAQERLREATTAWNHHSGRPYALQFSTGALAYLPARHASIEVLMQEADALMYERKRARQALYTANAAE